MTGMGQPKAGPSFPHDEIPWPNSPSPRFVERRHGMGWRVYEVGEDGLTRWTYTGTFWRWIKAARVSQALTLAFNAGYHSDGECWQRNKIVKIGSTLRIKLPNDYIVRNEKWSIKTIFQKARKMFR